MTLESNAKESVRSDLSSMPTRYDIGFAVFSQQAPLQASDGSASSVEPSILPQFVLPYEGHEGVGGDWCLPTLKLAGENAESALLAITRLVEAEECRRRARAAVARARFEQLLNMIVANAVFALNYGHSEEVAYSRKKGSAPVIAWPNTLPQDTFREVVDLLAKCGLLHLTTGRWGGNDEAGRCSTFRATASLSKLLVDHGLGVSKLSLDPTLIQLVRLRDTSKRAIPFLECRFSRRTKTNLEQINEQIARSELGLSVARTEELGAVPRLMRLPPQLWRKTLYRVFNNGSWGEGGRFYGGWWQYDIKAEWRAAILIDGEPTVELDYAGFSPRLIYHQLGLRYDDDPYQLDLAPRWEGIDVRTWAKRLLMTLLYTRKVSDVFYVERKTKTPRGFRKAVVDALYVKHSRISHLFGTGAGLTTQSVDALIAEAILLEGSKTGTTVLPVHDSFIVRASSNDWLLQTMHEKYSSIVGQRPIIK